MQYNLEPSKLTITYMVSDINLRKHGDIETTDADELCFE